MNRGSYGAPAIPDKRSQNIVQQNRRGDPFAANMDSMMQSHDNMMRQMEQRSN